MIARLLAGAALVVGVGLATPALAHGGSEPKGGCHSLPTVATKGGDAPALLSLPPKECKPPVKHVPPVVWDKCDNMKGWDVNHPDEDTRKPVATLVGLKFSGNQLIHHATTGIDVEHLLPGSFTAHPAPDQDSFFSVEVSGSDGGYGTLRWNTSTHKWNLVTGGSFYENTSAAALVDMPAAHRSHHVVSFGVGYTNSPPGTVTTTVSAVRFQGKWVSLTCFPPKHTHSPSPSASTSTSASASPSASVSTSASPSKSTATPVQGNAGGSNSGTGALAVTGAPAGLLAGLGALVAAIGGGAFYMSRRRRTRFQA